MSNAFPPSALLQDRCAVPMEKDTCTAQSSGTTSWLHRSFMLVMMSLWQIGTSLTYQRVMGSRQEARHLLCRMQSLLQCCSFSRRCGIKTTRYALTPSLSHMCALSSTAWPPLLLLPWTTTWSIAADHSVHHQRSVSAHGIHARSRLWFASCCIVHAPEA